MVMCNQEVSACNFFKISPFSLKHILYHDIICRTARKAMFLYFNFSPSVMLDSLSCSITVFPKVNWNWMYIRSSKGVQITGPSIKFTGHPHTPQRRCSDSYWSFGPVMNNLLLDQTIFYWTLPHVSPTLGKTAITSISFLIRAWR